MYCYRHKVDITCGATSSLLRVLAFPGPEGVVLAPQVKVQEDPSLACRPMDELLDPAFMPAYVAGLQEGGIAAVCGFVYANGVFRLWADDNFASDYFDTEEANARFAATAILPSYLFGLIVAPASRVKFYQLLVQYMLTETKGTTTMSMVTDTVGRDGGIIAKLLRVRYLVLNQGQYACFAMNLLPLDSYGLTAPLLLLPFRLVLRRRLSALRRHCVQCWCRSGRGLSPSRPPHHHEVEHEREQQG